VCHACTLCVMPALCVSCLHLVCHACTLCVMPALCVCHACGLCVMPALCVSCLHFVCHACKHAFVTMRMSVQSELPANAQKHHKGTHTSQHTHSPTPVSIWCWLRGICAPMTGVDDDVTEKDPPLGTMMMGLGGLVTGAPGCPGALGFPACGCSWALALWCCLSFSC